MFRDLKVETPGDLSLREKFNTFSTYYCNPREPTDVIPLECSSATFDHRRGIHKLRLSVSEPLVTFMERTYATSLVVKTFDILTKNTSEETKFSHILLNTCQIVLPYRLKRLLAFDLKILYFPTTESFP